MTTTVVEVDADLDPPADRPGVHRVVAGVDPHVMVAGDPGREPQRRIGQHRRERHHRPAVLDDPIGRPAAQRPVLALVRLGAASPPAGR